MTTNKEAERKQLEESQFSLNVRAVRKWRSSRRNAWPSASSDDAHETFLANFLHHQRQKLCKQELSEQRMQQLYNIPGFARAQHENQWNDTYLQVCNWVKKRRATQQSLQRLLPSQYSSDPEEKTLGKWIDNQKESANSVSNRQIIAERKALLEHIPGWMWEIKSTERDEINNAQGEESSFVQRVHSL